MQFLVLSRRKLEDFPLETYTPDLLEAEAEKARGLYIKGIIRQIWSRGDEPGACLIFEAGSAEEVRSHVHELPLFAKGMQEIVKIVPLEPYRGFGPRAA